MATSGSFNTSSYDGRYYQFSWTATQSVTNNQSTISWTLKALGGNSSWYAERTVKVVLAGATVYSKTDRVSRYTGTVASGTKVITHDSNGDASFSVNVQAAVYYSTVNCTGSKTFTLNNIPRKSTLSASNGTLGTAQTLTVTRKSSSFTHTITYSCGSATGTIATKSSSTSISFTPPLSLASQNTTGTSVSVKFTITTYNGSTSVGSNTMTISCAIPSSVKPSCSISVSDAAGYSVYVKGYSKFKITVKPTTAYGSAIASYSVKANGATYTSASVTTSVLASSGSLTITATVTDKRGRTGTATKTVTVYDKSTLSASNGTLDKAQNLTISRGYSGFKHTITYSCGSDSGTVVSKTSDTTINFKPPITLANQNTTGTSVSVKFTITTYCDDKSIGTNTKTITCSIPLSVTPSVDIGVVDTTGLAETYGAMVKGLSNLKVTLNTIAFYGSAIASYNTTVLGKKYTNSSFEVGLIPSTSDITISATVTDKRGRTDTETYKVTNILDYSMPSITKLTVGRCDADGTANDKGNYIQVVYSAAVTPLNNKNTAKYTLQYKKTSASSYTTGETSSGEYSISNRKFVFAADADYSYDVRLKVEDSHFPVTRTTSASTALTIIHVGADGKSLGIGKLAEESGVCDIGMKLRARNGLVVDSNWVDLTLDAAFTLYEGDVVNQPKYKVTGNVVTVIGAVSPLTAYTSSTENVLFASGIPKAYRPPENQRFVCQGSGMNRWLCTIKPNGELYVARYGTTEATTIPTSAWLAFNCTYQI